MKYNEQRTLELCLITLEEKEEKQIDIKACSINSDQTCYSAAVTSLL